ncbi:hypothetical protein ACFX1T_012929 [Malus domestica]
MGGSLGAGDQQSSGGSYGGSSNFRSPPPRNYEYECGGERDRYYENGGGMRRSRSYGDTNDSVSRNE